MKKQARFILLFIVLFTSFCSIEVAFAEPSNQQPYTSNGDISFYGEYEYPGEEKPSGILPNTSPPTNQGETGSGNRLPQTGENNPQLPIVLGGILILSSFLGIKKLGK
ncbi:hypothetical protein CKN82_03495 [Carnobacterium divergens]|uniref:Gram-positive cocci surface proteins LPxTG domain-containing protein n=2 Tax=Carnobacterium divergens TaxID=2748 RepID=A0A0R2I4G0_CARDV|nr:LPXTG cell wall anchor domain-containing protein [Carnobacterium divergens]ANZ98893.1 hypothetical protein BFC22_01730 [Carnobacterium divergens]KRN56807.1 hypothetical protein IV74_GL000816 [Carnobacterium divergens DSM 20623]MDO0875924.1 LPXTG cell wall anchor domain-containing protein [Carnobacterium divergens]MDT1959257.1 LPXTG cell wall anchor domain-containing protein [Carnobacterium divergens]MDT1975275.1 LPXTG cell wall anchor domain-containing protein [Carnobacterium divergens]